MLSVLKVQFKKRDYFFKCTMKFKSLDKMGKFLKQSDLQKLIQEE